MFHRFGKSNIALDFWERGSAFRAEEFLLVRAENGYGQLFLLIERRCGDLMSDESVPLALPLSRFATDMCEATNLYRELQKPLLRYLVCLGLSRDEAQDVVQDAFVSLQQHLAANGSKESIRSWLFRVAHNQARNRQKSFGRRFATPLDAGVESIADPETPERAILKKEKFERLGKAIRTLTESERECLLLRAGGLRYREIGEVMGISTSTVGDTVERAIRKLAETCNV
jgi:RNA polymerase sigma-70 factor (ECF subfamily)